MKKPLKITLIVFGSIVLLLLIGGLIGWLYVKSAFLNFEDDYVEQKEFKEITTDGYTFADRNGNGALDIYEDDRRSTEERAEDVLSQMTEEEKIHLLKGSGLASAMGYGESGEGIPGAVGTIVATPRLGLPVIYLSDGPAGLRINPIREDEDRTYYCTAFPIATLLASTWNTELVQQVGHAMGNEASEYGIDVILGPGANIHRHPLCGRNFEYYSEDPLLSGYIGAAMVNGIESNGVGTSVKHFVANNQETYRKYNDVSVSERAMREIYLKGFEIIVEKSQPWTIMSSYNKVNGTYASENKKLLTRVLRDEWGFSGLVMSDWFGGEDAAAMIEAGNDLLEPGTKKQWDALKEAYENGELSGEAIDASVKRILKLILESKKMDLIVPGNDPDLEAHSRITRQSAAEGMVLLKNHNDVLPLKNAKNVALLGETSYNFISVGTGSGFVNAAYTVSLEEGMQNVGFDIEKTSKETYEAHKSANPEAFEKQEGMLAFLSYTNPPEVPYTEEQLKEMAVNSDVAIITIGRNAGEGSDRVENDDFLLTAIEKEMITKTCDIFHEAEKPVVVVLNVSGVVETASWKSYPDAILLAWQGGQEGGNSVADILSGKVTPSGKLPMTFPNRLSDHASNSNFPLEGKPLDIVAMLFSDGNRTEEEQIKNEDYTNYEEGIYVGYRHFDKANLEVSYPFGYGLSYTEFEFSELSVTLEKDTITVSLNVLNKGMTSGKEVVQLYTSKPDSKIDRPNQELRAFAKTKELQPGETELLTIQVPVKELRYWDEEAADWALEKGRYSMRVGSSSRDIVSALDIEL